MSIEERGARDLRQKGLTIENDLGKIARFMDVEESELSGAQIKDALTTGLDASVVVYESGEVEKH